MNSMEKFRKLNLPQSCTLAGGEEKWFCTVEGTTDLFLNKDLRIRQPSVLERNFNSEEEALVAYNKYYYLHAKEPGH